MSTPEGPDQAWGGDEAPESYRQQQREAYYLDLPDPSQLPPAYGPQYDGPQYGNLPPAPPPRQSRAALAVLAVAVVVIAAAVIGIVVLVDSDDDKGERAQSPTPRTSAPATSAAPRSASASPSGGSSPTSVQQIRVTPVIKGWQGVVSYRDDVAYDVPPGWKVESPGVLVGFEDSGGQPLALMHGVSTYKDDACPAVSGSYRGHVGFKTTGDLAPATAARSGLQLFAQGIALQDDGSQAPVSDPLIKSIRVDRGKLRATYARATITQNDRSDCGSPTVVLVAVAFRTGPNSTALFIGYFDQGVADALPLSTLDRIFTTLRPYRR